MYFLSSYIFFVLSFILIRSVMFVEKQIKLYILLLHMNSLSTGYCALPKPDIRKSKLSIALPRRNQILRNQNYLLFCLPKKKPKEKKNEVFQPRKWCFLLNQEDRFKQFPRNTRPYDDTRSIYSA